MSHAIWRKRIQVVLVVCFAAIGFSLLPGHLLHSIGKAEEMPQVRKLNLEFVPETGSPVAMVSGKAECDLDSFAAPLDVRIYVDYQNVGGKPIEAVKFRMRFVDCEGNSCGTFHAPDAAAVPVGMTRSQRWKHDKVDPRVVGVKVRVLLVRFGDGSVWESEKMDSIVQPSK